MRHALPRNDDMETRNTKDFIINPNTLYLIA